MNGEESLLLAGVQGLREMGFFDFFLPLLLFFAIIYGALDKTKIFGEDKKDINAIIAFVISLIAATTSWVLKGVAGFLPWVGFIALVVVAFLMLAALIVGDVSTLVESQIVKVGGVLAVLIGLILGVWYGLGLNERFSGTGMGLRLTETDIALGFMILIGAAAFYMITKNSQGSGGSS